VNSKLPVTIGKEAIPSLIDYCKSKKIHRFYLVADQNTYPALGKTLEKALTDDGFDVKTTVLTGQEVIADEHYITQVLLHADGEDRVYLAVGSGTITDIVRFASHRTKSRFISMPTAPSVDGFTSGGAPLVIGGLKQTVYAQPPIAVFADLNTLCAAPRPMIASGYGDMLGKCTSLADWKLGHLVRDEPYDEEIAQRARVALENCTGHVKEIGSSIAEGIRRLMDGLIESGLCMLDFSSSHPASGAEHHISHVVEMTLLREDRPAILHGAKVGVGSIMMARLYEQISSMTRERVIEGLNATSMPDREEEIQRIRAAFPELQEQIIAEQASFLDLPKEAYDGLKEKITSRWTEIRDIAASVPPSQELTRQLREVGGAVDMESLGLNTEEVAFALEHAHYLRNRFTVIKLSRMLGIQLG
jgi:glycerol-1-phosphate dehydrogenase [NAD(P)+]